MYKKYQLTKGDNIKKTVKNSLLVAGAVSALGVSSLMGLQAVSAQSDNAGPGGLIDAIANKFNLNKDEVKTVFDTFRDERHQEMEQKRSERLQALVDDGTITAEQKSAIEAKHEEMESERESHKNSFKDMTAAERKAEMQEHKSELEAWAKENDLDLSRLKGVLGGPRGGHGGPAGQRHGRM